MNTQPATCARCDEPTFRVGLCLEHLRDAVVARKVAQGKCKEDGCTATSHARKMCAAHYAAWRRNRQDAPTCIADDCTRAATANGTCDRHRMRLLRTGTIAAPDTTDTPTTCTDPEGCTNDIVAGGLCRKHYQRQYRAAKAAKAAKAA